MTYHIIIQNNNNMHFMMNIYIMIIDSIPDLYIMSRSFIILNHYIMITIIILNQYITRISYHHHLHQTFIMDIINMLYIISTIQLQKSRQSTLIWFQDPAQAFYLLFTIQIGLPNLAPH